MNYRKLTDRSTTVWTGTVPNPAKTRKTVQPQSVTAKIEEPEQPCDKEPTAETEQAVKIEPVDTEIADAEIENAEQADEENLPLAEVPTAAEQSEQPPEESNWEASFRTFLPW